MEAAKITVYSSQLELGVFHRILHTATPTLLSRDTAATVGTYLNDSPARIFVETDGIYAEGNYLEGSLATAVRLKRAGIECLEFRGIGETAAPQILRGLYKGKTQFPGIEVEAKSMPLCWSDFYSTAHPFENVLTSKKQIQTTMLWGALLGGVAGSIIEAKSRLFGAVVWAGAGCMAGYIGPKAFTWAENKFKYSKWILDSRRETRGPEDIRNDYRSLRAFMTSYKPDEIIEDVFQVLSRYGETAVEEGYYGFLPDKNLALLSKRVASEWRSTMIELIDKRREIAAAQSQDNTALPPGGLKSSGLNSLLAILHLTPGQDDNNGPLQTPSRLREEHELISVREYALYEVGRRLVNLPNLPGPLRDDLSDLGAELN